MTSSGDAMAATTDVHEGARDLANDDEVDGDKTADDEVTKGRGGRRRGGLAMRRDDGAR